MRTLVKKLIRAQPVAQIVVTPWFIWIPVVDSLPINQYLHHSQVPLKVLRFGVSSCQLRRRERDIVLRADWRAMAKPRLQFEQRHRFPGIEELARDSRPRPVAADPAACICRWNASLTTKQRNQMPVQVVMRNPPRTIREQELNLLARLDVERKRLYGTRALPC